MLKIDDNVLAHMQDELSVELYKNQIAYKNGDMEAWEKIIRSTEEGKALVEFMDFHRDHLYIFGGGMLGEFFLREWKWKYSFQGIVDNSEKKQGGTMEEIPVIGLQKIVSSQEKNKAAFVITANISNCGEMEKQLREEGISPDHIFNWVIFRDRLLERQYFDLPQPDQDRKERFADCGAFDGKTSQNMFEWCRRGKNVDKIWLFEPDRQSAEKCRQNLGQLKFDRYEVIEKAVYSSATQLVFSSTGMESSQINEKGNVIIDTVSLDEAIGKEHPTFIKMDVEGAELEALKGARQIIRKDKPKLAICVYHKTEDIEEIPRLILEYRPDYKFYLRHYSLSHSELVLYAL